MNNCINEQGMIYGYDKNDRIIIEIQCESLFQPSNYSHLYYDYMTGTIECKNELGSVFKATIWTLDDSFENVVVFKYKGDSTYVKFEELSFIPKVTAYTMTVNV
jgi:hypothetical protein